MALQVRGLTQALTNFDEINLSSKSGKNDPLDLAAGPSSISASLGKRHRLDDVLNAQKFHHVQSAWSSNESTATASHHSVMLPAEVKHEIVDDELDIEDESWPGSYSMDNSRMDGDNDNDDSSSESPEIVSEI